ncbi:MAG: protein translocase subunit SecD [Candidatus Omnitrophica bacterium]|nr:protein translocase subunit SecD [Candidatus Omnitrophota bacterium]MCM8833008.1 protein translocase subunit SecD [Candidatus Omnitrophota bacterium]
MRTQFYIKFGVIVAVIGICFYLFYPPEKKVKKGLDLQGGIHVVLEVEKENLEEKSLSDLTERALEIIRNRVDALGVTEPVIQKEGTDRIIVDLPGVKEPEKAIDIIGKTALLEFKLVIDDENLYKQALQGNIQEGYELVYLKEKDERGIYRETQPLLLKSQPELTGKYIVDAYVGYDRTGFPDVNLVLDKEGAKIFEEVTGKNIGKRLAIVLDGVIKSAPQIRERIPEGKAVITGKFTMEEARELAIVLRSGALPAKLNIIYQEVIGPSLGKESVQKGFKSSLYGAIIVLIFMIFYYLYFGLLADFALALNILILLGIMAGMKGVLTLPGIAGIALTCGMAVDANILIFERIREELKAGKSPKASVDAGYHRAWAAIIDSNITTLITGLVLFIFGEGAIKGFGLTLSIGIIANLFTAVFATKVIVDWIIINKKIEKLRI